MIIISRLLSWSLVKTCRIRSAAFYDFIKFSTIKPNTTTLWTIINLNSASIAHYQINITNRTQHVFFLFYKIFKIIIRKIKQKSMLFSMPCHHKTLLKEYKQGNAYPYSQSQSYRKCGKKIIKKLHQKFRLSL